MITSAPRPIYLVGAPGPRRDSLAGDLGGPHIAMDRVQAEALPVGFTPGVVLLDAETLSPEDLLVLGERLGGGAEGWSVAVIGNGDPRPVRSLSFGFSRSLSDAGAALRHPRDHHGALLELHGVVADVSVIRHDLNNPLTSALAEVQLLLFDSPTEEVTEAMEILQGQLRRMRDMVAALGHIREPRKTAEVPRD
ncbi:MAG: hypothetical protein OEZ65_04470 [Gemmatimonadota bacterium]|nr:hypothetical protein [Gemmatimonadota bacterium]MDH5758820.1 hypothetical protein [Gemmatimonadota bacterium]